MLNLSNQIVAFKNEIFTKLLMNSRFRARLNVVCVTDKLTGELKCDGWPEVKVALAPVGALRPNATENNLQNAIR